MNIIFHLETTPVGGTNEILQSSQG